MFKLAKRIPVLFLINCAFGSIIAGPSLSKAKLSAETRLGLIKVIQEGEGRNFKLDLSGRDLAELDLRALPLLQLQRYRNPYEGRPRLPDTKFHVSNVTDLDLSGNQLQTLPAGINELEELKSLDLSDNNLRTLPREIGTLQRLITLKINNKHSEKQKLQELPPEIGNLTNLMVLDLSGNDLQELPKKFGNLKQLEYLHLDDNKFQSFPMQITKTKKLKRLDLSHNKLQTVPEEIGDLKELDWLELDFNKLQSVPAQIEGCIKLRGLCLHFNNLKAIPAEIGRMKNLKWLSLYCTWSSGPGNPQELQDRFEQLKRFIFKAIQDNHLPDVRGFIHLRAEPWHLHLKDFKDENGNNLLHLAVIHNEVQQEGHASKILDPEWRILKELLACNVNNSSAQMLKEKNAASKTPLSLLIARDGTAFNEICQKLCLVSAELPDSDEAEVAHPASSVRRIQYGPNVNLGKYEEDE